MIASQLRKLTGLQLLKLVGLEPGQRNSQRLLMLNDGEWWIRPKGKNEVTLRRTLAAEVAYVGGLEDMVGDFQPVHVLEDNRWEIRADEHGWEVYKEGELMGSGGTYGQGEGMPEKYARVKRAQNRGRANVWVRKAKRAVERLERL